MRKGGMMKRNLLLFSGVLAALAYVAAVLVGGLLRPGYDHLVEPVSELMAAGAPNKTLLDVLFLVYNGLVIVFGVGLFGLAEKGTRARVSGMVAALALIASSICGALLQLFFPQDPGGAQAAVTTTGTMHIAVASVSAILSMLALLSAALWFRKQPELKGYTVYSLVTLAVMFVSGGVGAAVAASGGSPLFGLIERITIGALIQWLFFVGLKLSATATVDHREVETAKPYHRTVGD
jgi:hypothetical protein